MLGAANGAPLVLDRAAQALIDSPGDRALLARAVNADLDRAADRHFDDFQRSLLTVAAMRAAQEATA